LDFPWQEVVQRGGRLRSLFRSTSTVIPKHVYDDVDNGPWHQLAEKEGDAAAKNALNEDDIDSARNIFGGRGGSTNLLGYGN
jgi:hypothetical protein